MCVSCNDAMMDGWMVAEIPSVMCSLFCSYCGARFFLWQGHNPPRKFEIWYLKTLSNHPRRWVCWGWKRGSLPSLHWRNIRNSPSIWGYREKTTVECWPRHFHDPRRGWIIAPKSVRTIVPYRIILHNGRPCGIRKKKYSITMKGTLPGISVSRRKTIVIYIRRPVRDTSRIFLVVGIVLCNRS